MDGGKIFGDDMPLGLRREAKGATIPLMTARRKPATTQTGDPFLDDPEAVVALAVRSFAAAKRAAIEENDRLGVPSYGAKGGKFVVRVPPQAKKAEGPSG